MRSRAVWSDGRAVAVKVQYPGADDALRADLKTLSRMTGLLSSVIPGADVKPLLAEITERTEEELDYRIEAANQRRFAAAFDGHPTITIPKVVAGAPKVIVTEWLDGTPVSALIKAGAEDPEGTLAQRNRIAELMGTFHFSSPELVGLLHGDPHPGNFLVREDGTLAVLDFGACAPMPDGFPEVLGRMLALAVADEHIGVGPGAQRQSVGSGERGLVGGEGSGIDHGRHQLGHMAIVPVEPGEDGQLESARTYYLRLGIAAVASNTGRSASNLTVVRLKSTRG
ncbi:AarF/UbiB family protein [Nocardioides sp. NPDC023903]|uniref:AarF/UbiB family protein n=1 Tax=Nocardioides sp. NPDC023903 TaxID=3157195 RepID=UPI0033D78ADF